MTKQQQLALGRIFRLMSRPSQPGDVEQYEAARAILMADAPDLPADYTPCWPLDRKLACAGGQD